MSSSEVEAELVELPDLEEKPKLQLCSPKLVIVTILALYFLSQNVYHYLTKPPDPESTHPLPEVDEWANFWELWDRFWVYLVITVVAFVVFYYLRESNDQV